MELCFFETSAKIKLNNEAAFFELVREIRKANRAAAGGRKPQTKKFCQIL